MLDCDQYLPNRKVRLTRTALKSALLELLQTRPLAQITITELCKHADVNRSTFYAHYSSVEDVLDDMEKEYLEHVAYISFQNSPDTPEQLFSYLKYAADHKELFMSLLENHRLIDPVYKKSLEVLKERNPRNFAEKQNQFTLTARFATLGTFGLIREWLEAENPWPIEYTASLLLELMKQVDQERRIPTRKIRLNH